MGKDWMFMFGMPALIWDEMKGYYFMHKKITLSITDFKTMIQENYYYVDKTLLIRDILSSGLKQLYFINPHMGKTLALSMLRYFFEDTGNSKLNMEHERLFVNTNIYKEPYFHMEACHYIVISLNFPIYIPPGEHILSNILQRWKIYVCGEFHNYNFVKTKLCLKEQELFNRFINCQVTDTELLHSIEFLIHCLTLFYNKECILIIDDFYMSFSSTQSDEVESELIKFYSLLLSYTSLSDGLKFAVYTGQPLFDAKEFSIEDSDRFDRYFSFTEEETQELLSYYDLADHYNFVMEWCGNRETHLFNSFLMMEYVFHIIECNQSQEELVTRWAPIGFLFFPDTFLSSTDNYNNFVLLSNGSDVSVSSKSKEYQYMIKCGIVTVVSNNTDTIIIRLTNNVMKSLIDRVLELHDMIDSIV